MKQKELYPMQWVALVTTFILELAMFILTVTSVINLVSALVPEQSKGLAGVAVFAAEGGLVAWPIVFQFGCGPYVKTNRYYCQKTISGIMSFICFFAVTVCFGYESHLQAARNGITERVDSGMGEVAVWVVIITIVLTAAACILFQQLMPHTVKLEQSVSYQPQQYFIQPPPMPYHPVTQENPRLSDGHPEPTTPPGTHRLLQEKPKTDMTLKPKCKNKACENTLTGRQALWCSGKCKAAGNRKLSV